MSEDPAALVVLKIVVVLLALAAAGTLFATRMDNPIGWILAGLAAVLGAVQRHLEEKEILSRFDYSERAAYKLGKRRGYDEGYSDGENSWHR